MDSIAHLRFKEEIRHYLRLLKEAGNTIMNQGVSMYPIFVFHRQELPIGIEISNPEKDNGVWFVSASTLEEFVAKQLIAEDRVNTFRKTYKDPSTHLCIFLVEEDVAEFIFIPKDLPGEN